MSKTMLHRLIQAAARGVGADRLRGMAERFSERFAEQKRAELLAEQASRHPLLSAEGLGLVADILGGSDGKLAIHGAKAIASGLDKFAEERKDARGHRYCYEKGKGKVACGQDSKSKDSKGKGGDSDGKQAKRPSKASTSRQRNQEQKALAAEGKALVILHGTKSPEKMKELAGHLGEMTVSQLKDLRSRMNLKADAKLKGQLITAMVGAMDERFFAPKAQDRASRAGAANSPAVEEEKQRRMAVYQDQLSKGGNLDFDDPRLKDPNAKPNAKPADPVQKKEPTAPAPAAKTPAKAEQHYKAKDAAFMLGLKNSDFKKLVADGKIKTVDGKVPASEIERLYGKSNKTSETAGQHSERFSEGNDTISGCQIFRTGVHRGKPYSEADLDDMVENFDRFSRDNPGTSGTPGQKVLLRVPSVLGHEENQEWLDRTDLPAAAWANRIYRKGPVLYADFVDVHPKVARLIKGKAYRKVSSEVYDEPPEGIPGKGKMLRRVAFLGGEIPQIKNLDDIPAPESHRESRARYTPVMLQFSESKDSCSGGSCSICFAEVPMDREAMLSQLGEAGFDTSTITDAVPDEALAEMLRVAQAGQEDLGGEGEDDLGDEGAGDMEGGTEGDMEGMGDDSGMEGDMGGDEGGMEDEDEFADDADEDDSPVAEDDDSADMGEEGDDPTMQDDDEEEMPPPPTDAMSARRFYNYASKMCNKYGASDVPVKKGEGPGNNGVTVPPAPTQKEQENMGATQYAELSRKVKTLQKYTEKNIRAQRRAYIDTRLKALVSAGKVLPAEIDSGLPETLYAMDDAKVHKFSEKDGKGRKKLVDMTQLERQLQILERRPILISFAERMKDPARTITSEDEEVAKVDAHYEQFSEAFNKTGTTKEKVIKGFKTYRKNHPGATAEQFLKV